MGYVGRAAAVGAPIPEGMVSTAGDGAVVSQLRLARLELPLYSVQERHHD